MGILHSNSQQSLTSTNTRDVSQQIDAATNCEILHTLDTDREAIEARINQLIDQQCNFNRYAESTDYFYPLIEDLATQAHVSNAGGKRLRALLALAWFDACQQATNSEPSSCTHGDECNHIRISNSIQRDAMMSLASAIEMYQTAALVHDDIIDDADTRRSKPTAHRALARPGVSGTGLGIMFGDLLTTISMSILTELNTTHEKPVFSQHILHRFMNMHRDVELGQMLDLASEHMPLDQPQAIIANAMKVYRWKTASYTTIAPLALAGLAAGLHPQVAHAWSMRVGLPLGLAFQIADDLIDVTENPHHSGKPLGGDIREGKRTILLADTLQAVDTTEREFIINAYMQAHRDEATCKRIIELMHTSGAVGQSQSRITVLYQQSVGCLQRAAKELSFTTPNIDNILATCSLFVPQVHK